MRSFPRLLLSTVLFAPAILAQAPPRAVLVTGASSGIGRRIAERLATEGFYVHAGARKAEDIAELSKIPSMKGVRLDVTSASDIAAAATLVERDSHGLYGVANNADRAKGTPFEAAMEGFVRAMENYDNYPEPDDVAKAALHAFTSAKPQPRYMVVPAAGQAAVTIRKAMDELVQLNQGHQFTYDRDALVRMLDEALAKVK